MAALVMSILVVGTSVGVACYRTLDGQRAACNERGGSWITVDGTYNCVRVETLPR
jgi:hypothetical protein